MQEPPDDANLQSAVKCTGAKGIVYDLEGWLGSSTNWQASCNKYIAMFPDLWHIACPLGHGRTESNQPRVIYPPVVGFTHIAPMAYGGAGSYGTVGQWTKAFVKGVFDKTQNDGWPKSKTFLTFQSASIANLNANAYAPDVIQLLLQQRGEYAGMLGWGSSENDNKASGHVLFR